MSNIRYKHVILETLNHIFPHFDIIEFENISTYNDDGYFRLKYLADEKFGILKMIDIKNDAMIVILNKYLSKTPQIYHNKGFRYKLKQGKLYYYLKPNDWIPGYTIEHDSILELYFDIAYVVYCICSI